MTRKIERPLAIPILDPFDGSFTAGKPLGFEAACLVLVYLKSYYYSIAREKIPAVNFAFVNEIIEGDPKPSHRLAELTVTSVDYLGGHREGTKRELRRAREHLPLMIGGSIHFSRSRFIYIEVGGVDPLTERAKLDFHPTNCRSAVELVDYVKKSGGIIGVESP